MHFKTAQQKHTNLHLALGKPKEGTQKYFRCRQKVPEQDILFLELDSKALKAIASFLNVVARYRDMAEALGFFVAVMVTLEARVALGSMVMGKLQDSLSVTTRFGLCFRREEL